MTTSPQGRWTLGGLLSEAVASSPDATALIAGSQRRRISYRQLDQIAAETGDILRQHGLRAGDVLAVALDNSVEFVASLLAATRLGATVAPLDPRLPAAETRQRLDMLGARVLLSGSPVAADDAGAHWSIKVEGLNDLQSPLSTTLVAPTAPRSRPAPGGLTDSDALIMFTSGSTGRPKMVPWTHQNVAAGISAVTGAYRLTARDATVAVMPLFHGHGLMAVLLSTLATGGTVLLPARGNFTAHTFWDDIGAAEATWYSAVPTIHEILLARVSDEDVTRPPLRFIRSCSAPLSAATAQRVEETFHAPVLAAYGLTEATHQVSSVHPGADITHRRHTVGQPTGTELRIVSSEGTECPIGVGGQVWLRGPTVVRGYLGDRTTSPSPVVDGWLPTGDLGVLDEAGALSVTGRIKNLINRGGEKISPEHVEAVLQSAPGVQQAAVLGVPDSLYGERVAAVIVADTAGLDISAVRSYLAGRLAPFEIPDHVDIVNALPTTAKGDIDRAALSAQISAQLRQASPVDRSRRHHTERPTPNHDPAPTTS